MFFTQIDFPSHIVSLILFSMLYSMCFPGSLSLSIYLSLSHPHTYTKVPLLKGLCQMPYNANIPAYMLCHNHIHKIFVDPKNNTCIL